MDGAYIPVAYLCGLSRAINALLAVALPGRAYPYYSMPHAILHAAGNRLAQTLVQAATI